MNIHVFFLISMADLYFEKKLLYDSLVLTLNKSFLLQARYKLHISHFPQFLQKLNYSLP